jgi:hypothetical protein
MKELVSQKQARAFEIVSEKEGNQNISQFNGLSKSNVSLVL